MTDPVVTQAREILASEWFGEQWSDVRRNIIDGSCTIHSDPISLANSLALSAMLAFAQQARLEGERAGMEKARSICAQIDIGLQRQPPYGSGAAQCYHAINDAIRNTGATK